MGDSKLGKKFDKPDIERLGIFAEMSYMHGKRYTAPISRPSYIKGANFYNSGRKSKNGTQHGYFEDEFKRVFIGEGIVRKKKAVKTSGPPPTPFRSNFVPKKHSTPGDIFGTFTSEVIEFSPKTIKVPYKREPPNMIGKSGKIGGPGYADSGIDKYPEHLPDPYGRKPLVKKTGVNKMEPFHNASFPMPFFEPNPYTGEPLVALYLDRSRRRFKPLNSTWIPNGPPKMQGGCHAGCFDKFPEYKSSKYVSIIEANKPFITNKGISPAFTPTFTNLKTQFTTSILNHSVEFSMNTKNADIYVPCYVEYLLKDKIY